MRTSLLFRIALLFCFCLFLHSSVLAQTPGLIYKPATSSGAKVMDPNGDGYVSMTKSGFSGTNDEGPSISEIPYRPFPALTTEPIADLNTGSTGGHTDLATPTISNSFTGSPVAAYFDGTNLMFRLRLGSSSTASKGYSVLIDSDGKFDSPGTNPGFEYEVLLASNFAVQVIKHTATGSTAIFTGSVDQYSQRAVAASTSGGNADYFYDFYVPLTAFNGGITANTPLRMSGITITSAQSGLTGTVSDVGGVNFMDYNYDAPAAWRALLGLFPATSISTLQTSEFPKIAAAAPVVTGPILANSTSISGTSTEAAGAVITVFRNGVAICGGAGQPTCPTVTSKGTWTISGLSSSLLVAGDVITATVSVTGKTVSGSSNSITVSTGVCLSTPPPTITGLNGTGQNRGFSGTTNFIGNQRIRIYAVSAPTVVVASVDINATTAGTAWATPTVNNLTDNSFYATSTPLSGSALSGCESLRSNQICYRNGQPNVNNQSVRITSVVYNTVTQSITDFNNLYAVPTNLTSISGTINLNSTSITGFITLFKNGNPTTEQVSFTSSSTTWTITPSAAFLSNLKVGDVISVRTDITLTGGGSSTCANSYSLPSNYLTVQETTTAPTVNPPQCGMVTSLIGTSTEVAGTEIQFYTGGTQGQRNGTLVVQSGTSNPIVAIVSSTGTWTANFTSVAGGGIAAGTIITARAKAPGKVRSLNSNTVSSVSGPTGTLTVNPITEGATSVSGTGPVSASGAKVTLYIEGTPYSTPVLVNVDGTWTVTGIASQELFAGAVVTATFTPTDGCESAKSAAVTVSCKAPITTYTLSASPTNFCGGGVTSITLSGSEYGISYRLLVNGIESGSSVLGTGSPIVLTSGPITNYTSANITPTITYRARKVSGAACDAISTNSTSVTVRPQPVTTNLSFASTSQAVCANSSTTFTLNGTSTSYTYQLLNQTTNTLVGTRVQGVSSGSISLSTGTVSSNTTYSLRIAPVTEDANSCATILQNQVSVTISSPAVTGAVYAEASKVCVGGATNIYVATEANSDFSYTVYRRVGATPNPGSDPQLGTFTGNGGVRSVSTGDLNTAGVQTFYVTVRRITNNVCGTLTMVNTAQVEVTNNTAVSNAGNNQSVCGSSTTLQANTVSSGTGTWSQISGPSTASFSALNNPNATVQNLTPGSYTFRWTVQSSCGTTTSTATSDVTITVNCDAYYTLAVPKYKNEYSQNEVLATATDPDGAITSASITQGSLPPGTAMSSSNGTITVVNINNLQEGIYPLTIKLVDSFGRETITNIVLRMYGNAPSITPLPVELVYFRATSKEHAVELKWLTASEENNKEFVVERSVNGKNFAPIGTVVGAGTTRLPQYYTFTDKYVPAGTVYYRLRQIDNDGKYEFSNVVAIRHKEIAAQDKELKVWPNPFEGDINVELYAPVTQEVRLVISDLKGRMLYEKAIQLKMGINRLSLPLQELSKGMYILHLQGAETIGKAKVIKR